jgi:hypothetical protein
MPRRRRGKRHHHGGDVCGIVVVGLRDFSVIFLLWESYGAGVFHSRSNPNRGIPVNICLQFCMVTKIDHFI